MAGILSACTSGMSIALLYEDCRYILCSTRGNPHEFICMSPLGTCICMYAGGKFLKSIYNVHMLEGNPLELYAMYVHMQEGNPLESMGKYVAVPCRN